MAVWHPSKKHLSPIPIKMAFCTPYFEKYSPFVYRCSHLIATGKPKVHPLSKKYFSPIWIKTAFWIPCFENCSPNIYGCPHIIATEKWKPHPLLKNISHLYARKSGFRDHVSIRIYIMFTNPPSPIRTKNSRFTGASAIYLHFVYTLGVLSLT